MRFLRLVLATLVLWSIPLGALATPANDQIDRLFSAYDRPNVPGASVLVVKDGAVIYQKGYGASDLEAGELADEATNYRLASLTKQFTAMAIMMLKEDGVLNYEQTLTEVLPDFPSYGSRIKIRHLLNHTSGLRDYEDLIPSGQREQVKDRDVVELLKRQTSTYFTPGSSYRYSNSGYATLAHIVQTVSGMRFAEFLEERIFAPLGMAATVAYENGVSTVAHRAYGYTSNGGGWDRTDQSVTSAVLGDGGVYTSPVDYFKWDQALYTETLVSAETLAEAFTPGRLSGGARTSYGFGWMLDTYRGHRRIHHTGSTIGFRTAVQRFPDQHLTVLVLVNRANASPWDVAEQIADLYL
jgi:CubicO group peptidase (beta-lactamase class C family)